MGSGKLKEGLADVSIISTGEAYLAKLCVPFDVGVSSLKPQYNPLTLTRSERSECDTYDSEVSLIFLEDEGRLFAAGFPPEPEDIAAVDTCLRVRGRVEGKMI